jgi:acyl carrier protein
MAPQRDEVLTALSEFIAREILDGHDIGLDGRTPLLEWGIINSFEIARVVAFVADRFGVRIPPQRIEVRHFDTLEHLSELVVSLAAPPLPVPPAEPAA